VQLLCAENRFEEGPGFQNRILEWNITFGPHRFAFPTRRLSVDDRAGERIDAGLGDRQLPIQPYGRATANGLDSSSAPDVVSNAAHTLLLRKGLQDQCSSSSTTCLGWTGERKRAGLRRAASGG
jgi:hypothetical protein